MSAPNPGQKRRAAIVAAVVFGVPMTLALGAMTGNWPVAAYLGLGGGVIFGVAIMLFAGRMEGQAGNANLVSNVVMDDEPVVREGPANHFKGVEGVGGKLFLTDQRLRFVSHALNVQTHDTSWPLDTIADVEPTKSLKIIPNGLRVTLKDGTTERFVVWHHQEWADAIEQARA